MQVSKNGPDYTGRSMVIACGMWVGSFVMFALCIAVFKSLVSLDGILRNDQFGELPTVLLFGGYLWGMDRLSKKVLEEKKIPA